MTIQENLKSQNWTRKLQKNLKFQNFLPPPPEKPEISQLLPKQEQFKIERLRIKQEKELAWELRKLCHKFLEDNDKDWLKRKNERQEEEKRIERVEKMKRLSKEAKIDYIEKKIEIGLEKIPVEDKVRIEKEEKLRERKKIQEIKQSLWKLRKKEKKLENPETEKIKNKLG